MHVPHVRKALLPVDGEARSHEGQHHEERQERVERALTRRVARHELDGHISFGESGDHRVLRMRVRNDGHRRVAVLQLQRDSLAVDLGLHDVPRPRVSDELRVADGLDVWARKDSHERPSDAERADER